MPVNVNIISSKINLFYAFFGGWLKKFSVKICIWTRSELKICKFKRSWCSNSTNKRKLFIEWFLFCAAWVLKIVWNWISTIYRSKTQTHTHARVRDAHVWILCVLWETAEMYVALSFLERKRKKKTSVHCYIWVEYTTDRLILPTASGKERILLFINEKFEYTNCRGIQTRTTMTMKMYCTRVST